MASITNPSAFSNFPALSAAVLRKEGLNPPWILENKKGFSFSCRNHIEKKILKRKTAVLKFSSKVNNNLLTRNKRKQKQT
jgi:hypothetical protein